MDDTSVVVEALLSCNVDSLLRYRSRILVQCYVGMVRGKLTELFRENSMCVINISYEMLLLVE